MLTDKQTLAFKREHENTQAKIPDKQSKRDSVESNSKQEVRRSKSEQEDQRHSGSMQREVHDLSGGMPSHQKQVGCLLEDTIVIIHHCTKYMQNYSLIGS